MRLGFAPQHNLVALANRIQPNSSELLSANLHRASVRGRLMNSFAVANVHPMGSHARGTAIRWYSDLDMMAVLRKEEFLWGGRLVSSDTILDRVLAELRARFPRSAVRRDGLAAAIEFGGSKQNLDVVPAMFTRFANGRPVFRIPDGDGGWFDTSPATHDRYFEVEQARSGSKLRKVSQLLKWWRHARSPAVAVQSFHIDMFLAARGICIGAKTYASCLKDFFEAMTATECGALVDPCGIAGRVAAASTVAQRDLLNRAVAYASDHARSAIAAETRRDLVEANRQWGLVFNGTY
jgi:hypothetical protein